MAFETSNPNMRPLPSLMESSVLMHASRAMPGIASGLSVEIVEDYLHEGALDAALDALLEQVWENSANARAALRLQAVAELLGDGETARRALELARDALADAMALEIEQTRAQDWLRKHNC